MARTENFESAAKVSTSAPFVELYQYLASHAAAISPFVDQLMHFIRLFIGKFGISKNAEGEIEIAIFEALANAVIHGNQENTNKNVDVICRCSMDGEVLITVRDQGAGF